jgi:hypothetical protein
MKPSGPCISSAEIHDNCPDQKLIKRQKIQHIQKLSTLSKIKKFAPPLTSGQFCDVKGSQVERRIPEIGSVAPLFLRRPIMFRRNRSFLALMLIGALLLAAVALSVDYKYMALKRGKKYHYPNCEYAQKKFSSVDSKLVYTFNSAKEAQDAGYKPCKICKPPITD